MYSLSLTLVSVTGVLVIVVVAVGVGGGLLVVASLGDEQLCPETSVVVDMGVSPVTAKCNIQ